MSKDVIKLEFAISKENISNIAKETVKSVEEGHQSPIDLMIKVRALEDLATMIKKEIKEDVVDELMKYGSKEDIVIRGVKLAIASKRTFNYKSDADWVKLEKDKKDREAFLKGLQKPMADPDTGDIISPPSFTTSTFPKVTIP